MYEARCHCGKVRITVAELPDRVTDCNCSICSRYGALWAYYRQQDARIEAEPGTVTAYAWGDHTIEFCHCANCGCVTHYLSVEKGPQSRCAINARMWPAEIRGSLPIRRFDGADTWTELD